MSATLAGGLSQWETHEVVNQPPAAGGRGRLLQQPAAGGGAGARGRRLGTERAAALGQFVGGIPQQFWGRLANENKPVLHTHDRYGHRIDEVEFHPAWHKLMAMGVENELHSLPWTSSEPSRARGPRARCT